MSAGPEPGVDLVAVACVVESSLLLASEWSRVLIEYVYPLLRRLNELHPSHQVLALLSSQQVPDSAFLVPFSICDVWGCRHKATSPALQEILCSPLSSYKGTSGRALETWYWPNELWKRQRIVCTGRTCGCYRGVPPVDLGISFWLHILLKLFDILMLNANFTLNHAPTKSPQKEGRSLISHLLHIAASPPDNAQRPHYNMLEHLDSVNWDSIPAELRKVSDIPWTRLGV